MSASCLVVVFAKAPLAGYAKTRLIPALGEQGAADLALRLLRHAVEEALAARLGAVELCCAPDARHQAFSEVAQSRGLVLSDQGEGDLGQRMARAFEHGLARQAKMLLIGSDAPALDAGVLRSAAAALNTHAAVFVPALDGGYVLIGLRQTPVLVQPALAKPGRHLADLLPALFDAMPWSTPQVMQRSRERLARLGVVHTELAALPDVDTPADLVHVPEGWL